MHKVHSCTTPESRKYCYACKIEQSKIFVQDTCRHCKATPENKSELLPECTSCARNTEKIYTSFYKNDSKPMVLFYDWYQNQTKKVLNLVHIVKMKKEILITFDNIDIYLDCNIFIANELYEQMNKQKSNIIYREFDGSTKDLEKAVLSACNEIDKIFKL